MNNKEHAEYYLKEIVPNGSAIYTTVMHVAQSGLSRHIKVLRPDGDEVRNISYYVAEALGLEFLADGIQGQQHDHVVLLVAQKYVGPEV